MAQYLSFGSMYTRDESNNLHRRCSLKGDETPRRWRVWSAMADNRFAVVNVDSGESRSVYLREMHNLY